VGTRNPDDVGVCSAARRREEWVWWVVMRELVIVAAWV
jgi:hypothetical protein